MSSAYTPYLISEFKTGINTYLQPWIRPIDAFDPLVNAYIYRGTINKRAGYSQFGDTLDDDNPVMGIMVYIDQSSGAQSLLVATTENLYLFAPGSTPDSGSYTAQVIPSGFSGTINNFFNWTNWQDSPGATSFLFMTNNVDPVTLWDGTAVTQPTLTVDGAGQTIDNCLDVKVYKQRILYIRPTLSTDGIQNQSIYWSAVSNATDVITDTAGHGGFLAAPTGDIIQSSQFVRDVLVVFFTNSTWIFRYTGNDTSPFRWDKINSTKTTNAPYASVPYDERCTSIGNTGLIACDGANVQRYDISIIDYYENTFNQTYFAQSFAQRYDNLNQAWMFYVSQSNEFPLVGSIAPGSDQALIYNFLENSWATYEFSVPMTCMGIFYAPTGIRWEDLTTPWEDVDIPWQWYTQKAAPILLAGDTTGHVYHMDNGLEVTDNGTSFTVDIISTRWNPIISLGRRVQFGYVDIYYYISSTNASDPIQVTLDFYVDNGQNSVLTRTLTLDGPTQASFAFKRVYINLIGEFIQMEIDPTEDSFIQFVGFVLWARPSGRLTPP